MEKTFTDCSLVPPKDHAPKLLRIPTKPQNLQKFSPSRVSCYTVQQLDDMLRRVKGEPPSKGSSSSVIFKIDVVYLEELAFNLHGLLTSFLTF